MASPKLDYIRATLISSYQFHKLRDEMNSVIHQQKVIYSPLTLDLEKALRFVHEICNSPPEA